MAGWRKQKRVMALVIQGEFKNRRQNRSPEVTRWNFFSRRNPAPHVVGYHS